MKLSELPFFLQFQQSKQFKECKQCNSKTIVNILQAVVIVVLPPSLTVFLSFVNLFVFMFACIDFWQSF